MKLANKRRKENYLSAAKNIDADKHAAGMCNELREVDASVYKAVMKSYTEVYKTAYPEFMLFYPDGISDYSWDITDEERVICLLFCAAMCDN